MNSSDRKRPRFPSPSLPMNTPATISTKMTDDIFQSKGKIKIKGDNDEHYSSAAFQSAHSTPDFDSTSISSSKSISQSNFRNTLSLNQNVHSTTMTRAEITALSFENRSLKIEHETIRTTKRIDAQKYEG